jgi:hypothetical protein
LLVELGKVTDDLNSLFLQNVEASPTTKVTENVVTRNNSYEMISKFKSILAWWCMPVIPAPGGGGKRIESLRSA